MACDGPLQPNNAAQVCDIVAWAVSEEQPLEIVGHGTKRAIGRAAQHAAALDLSEMTGITLYEPEELVLGARAGTPMQAIEAELIRHKQHFAFEPPDLSRVLGGPADAGTIGGAVASNLAGPRRIQAGAVRDHFLGVNAVSGRGELFKSGGRVVKNVTGYDLCKLLAGSWGTLAVMTDITLKVLPAPETEATLLVPGVDAARAVEAMSAAMRSAFEVSGACFLPPALAGQSRVKALAGATSGFAALRLEGIAPSVDYRADGLAGMLEPFGDVERLDPAMTRALWREVRDVEYLAGDGDRPLWRISVPPSAGAHILDRFADATGARGFLDWAGGLIWLEFDPSSDAGAGAVRSAVHETGGHATLIRAPETTRAVTDVFQPQPAGLEQLSRRLKRGFDPDNILNAGRMRADT